MRAARLNRAATAARIRTRRLLDGFGRRSGDQLVDPLSRLHLDGPFDAWLSLFDAELTELDAACEQRGPGALPLFRELDDDLWTVLLSRSYERYPNIRELIPVLPSASLQRRWNGTAGLELLSQGKAFYRKVRAGFARRSEKELVDASVLDFGCGWGRLTRFFIRDLEPGCLFGCDTVEAVLDFCRESRLPAEVALCDPRPSRVPFERDFDLIFAFSVFTHLSEPAHEACLRAIHAALAPGGLLLVTIRPPAYLIGHQLGKTMREVLGEDLMSAPEGPQYLFSPHTVAPGQPRSKDGTMDYGETVISLPYVKARWSEFFDLLDVSLLTEDMHQVVLTLGRRD